MHTHKKIGLIACCAIVAGNMMGSGIAMLPASLAAIGSISLLSWVLAIIGALGLAFVFARLGLLDPQEGGPVAYSMEVSPILGFQAQTLYFHANWIGNLAIAITSVSYFQPILPILKDPIIAGFAVIGEIWVLTAINLMGAHWIGRLASWGLAFVLIPVVGTAIFGWLKFDPHTFSQNWNVTNNGDFHAVISGVLLCIWSFIGVESASVDSAVVDNPQKTIPISTILGVLIAAIVYVLSTTVINGMFPIKEIANSNAPFPMAVSAIFSSPLLGKLTGLLISLACFASLGSWIMLVALAGSRASKDGTLPKAFAKLNSKGVPVRGVVYTSVFMTILMIILMFNSSSTQAIFSQIISIAVLLTVLPYFYSALHLIQISPHTQRGLVQLIGSIVGILFCLAAFFGATIGALIGVMVVSLGIMVFYVNRQRKL